MARPNQSDRSSAVAAPGAIPRFWVIDDEEVGKGEDDGDSTDSSVDLTALMTANVDGLGEEEDGSDYENLCIETIGNISPKEYWAQRKSAPWTTNRAWAKMPDHLRRNV